MVVEHVAGKNKGKIMLYALSTCGWCRKTKELLDSLGLEYSCTYMDLIEGKEKEDALKDLEKWNPRYSYPTIIIDDKTSIVGFKEDEIKKAIGL